MKNFILTIIVFVLGINSSCISQEIIATVQKKDLECVKERWLTLYKMNNATLYSPKEANIDPYQEIKTLLLNGKIRLYTERENNPEWLTSPLPSMIHDSIPYLDGSVFYNMYFDYKSEGDATLKTVNGEDSMYTYPDGTQSYLYPATKYEPLTFDKISEFRIKEILIQDSISQVNTMKPSLIGFEYYTGRHNLLFWVKIDDLKEHIQLNKSWINTIVNRKYSGFIYKQYSCYDPIYEWKKVYH